MNSIAVTIFGNLVDHPRRVQTAGGALTKFRVANTPRLLRDGTWVDGDTSYFDVTCWNRMADFVAGSLTKGDPVLVHGRMAVREWATETKSGKDVEIRADHVGHNLRYGTSLFKKPERAAAERVAEADYAPLPDEAPAEEDTAAA